MLKRSLAIASFVLLFVVPAAGAATIVPTRFDNPAFPAGQNCPSDCSLRGAIAGADDGDTISLLAGAYDVGNAVLTISGSIDIVGAGARSTSITSSGHIALINVTPSGAADFANLSLTAGEGSSAGALWNQGIAGLKNVSVTGNSGGDGGNHVVGGAINNAGILVIGGSTLANNSAAATASGNAFGGAIYNTDNLIVVNSTFSGNFVQTASGQAYGGAIYATTTSTNYFYNTTFGSGNNTIAASPGNSIGGQAYTSGAATWQIANTVFTDSLGPNDTDTCSIAPTNMDSTGGNVDPTAGFCGADLPTDAISNDPQLAPLANNGGQTDTQRISATGPAAGLGIPANCSTPALLGGDQRGGLRVAGASCDSGAVELNSLADVSLSGSFGKVTYGSPVPYSVTLTNNGPDPILGATVTGANCAIGPLAVGASATCAGSIKWNGDSVITQSFSVSGAFNDSVGPNSLTITALAPRLTTVSLRPPKITPTKSGVTLGTKSVKGAAKLKYTGIDLASLRVPVQSPVKGNIKSGKCVKRKTGTKPKGKSCVLWKTLTTVTIKNAKTSGTLYLTGRVKNKALKTGKYRLALTAVASNGNVGSPWYLAFSVK